MTEKNLVSIIIPTFNRADLLVETLDSIIEQTYKNWECLVIDDGSTEESLFQIKNLCLQDKRIKFLKRTEFNIPKGANACRNIGIEEANGDFIIFFDSDDLFLPHSLQQRLDYFKKHPEYDFVVFQIKSFSKDENIVSRLFTEKKDNYLHAFLSHSIPWPIMAPMLKTSFVKKTAGFDLKMPRLQDPDFYTSLLLLKDINFTVLHDREPDMLYRANNIKPNLTNVLTGFSLYLKKYLNIPSENIDPKTLRILLRECYYKAYNYFFIFYEESTKKDNKLLINLTFIAFKGKLINFNSFLKNILKIFYYS